MTAAIATFLRRPVVKSLIITLVVCAAYMGPVSDLKFVKIARLKMLDTLFSLQHKLEPPSEALDETVIVSLDDESFRETGLRWPWPRGVIAGLVNKISAHEPALICIDLVFAGESVDERQDFILSKAMKDAGNVFTAAYFGSDGRYTVPHEPIARGARSFGFINKPRDADNTVRRMRPFMVSTKGDIIDYPLSAKVAAYYRGMKVEDAVRAMPLLKDKTAYVRFFAKKKEFDYVPAWKVLEGKTAPGQLKGKMVFVGPTAELFHDIYQTPLGLMSGVCIVVNETLTLLTNRFYRYASGSMNFLILLAFVFIAVLCGLRLPVLSGIVISLSEVVSFYLLAFMCFLKGIILDPFGAIFLVAALSLFLYSSRYIMVIAENIMLRKESVTDGLTQLYVYRYFELALKAGLKKALLENKPLTLELLDIDFFKKVNDTYGHEFGNTVLKCVAGILKDNSRSKDTVARYGGEEFCVVMPGTKRDNALVHGERIRNKVKQAKFTAPNGEAVSITISIGIASTEDHAPESHLDLIHAADTALYRSKQSGRDNVTVFDKKANRL